MNTEQSEIIKKEIWKTVSKNRKEKFYIENRRRDRRKMVKMKKAKSQTINISQGKTIIKLKYEFSRDWKLYVALKMVFYFYCCHFSLLWFCEYSKCVMIAIIFLLFSILGATSPCNFQQMCCAGEEKKNIQKP